MAELWECQTVVQWVGHLEFPSVLTTAAKWERKKADSMAVQ